MHSIDDKPALIAFIDGLAAEAGHIALTMREEAAGAAERKDDGSPVTAADRRAEEIIEKGLHSRFPDIPIVGEERVSTGTMPDISSGCFWLVDPIDGTKDYVSGGPEFTVNIGLIVDFVPVAGVVLAPALSESYFGAVGLGAQMRDSDGAVRDIAVSGNDKDNLRVVASRRHDSRDAIASFLEGRSVAEWVSRSSSLKFCLVAADKADLYPRVGPTHEWDTAAGDAVVRAAGGSVTDLAGATLQYGKLPKLLNEGFVVRAHP